MKSEFMTPAEVGELARVHEATVRRWVREGYLKALKLGPRFWRIRRADVEAFLAEGTSTGGKRHA